MANDLRFTVTSAGKSSVLYEARKVTTLAAFETLSNLLVIHTAKQISELPLDEIITENMMFQLIILLRTLTIGTVTAI